MTTLAAVIVRIAELSDAIDRHTADAQRYSDLGMDRKNIDAIARMEESWYEREDLRRMENRLRNADLAA